ncbi:unnamed protein product [Ranitomeya imitator]|uniref:Uncharacterized protein n=1 Tax=Ranitomeya imitator TaxID=111125 RepID=A0ABN9L8W2_9NEOB|nr:unnamed protein product [Ranitomeya imitator]
MSKEDNCSTQNNDSFSHCDSIPTDELYRSSAIRPSPFENLNPRRAYMHTQTKHSHFVYQPLVRHGIKRFGKKCDVFN